MNEELHLFIIWEYAQDKKKEIIEDLKKQLNILNAYQITWSHDRGFDNYKRLYATEDWKIKVKVEEDGIGPFTLITVMDKNPDYKDRKTPFGLDNGLPDGIQNVNEKIFDLKMKYRDWTGWAGSHRVHATSDIDEARHDLAMVLGVDYNEYLEEHKDKKWNGKEISLMRDIEGSKGWRNFKHFFKIINNTVPYVVLRNFDDLLENGTTEDLDILTKNYFEFAITVGAESVFPRDNTDKRVQELINIDGNKIQTDVRHLGDDYYDWKWQEEILGTRQMHPDGFYIPNDENLFYSMLYHALIHKPEIHEKYYQPLSGLARKLNIGITDFSETNKKNLKKLLDKFMFEKGYKYVIPKDKSVYYNEQIHGGKFTRMIKRFFGI